MAVERRPGQLFRVGLSRRCQGRLDRWCAVTVLAGLAVTHPLATTLSDPLWVPGLYDGGDFDDLIASATEVGPFGPGPSTIPEVLAASGRVSVADETAARATGRPPCLARAPPRHGSPAVCSPQSRTRPGGFPRVSPGRRPAGDSPSDRAVASPHRTDFLPTQANVLCAVLEKRVEQQLGTVAHAGGRRSPCHSSGPDSCLP